MTEYYSSRFYSAKFALEITEKLLQARRAQLPVSFYVNRRPSMVIKLNESISDKFIDIKCPRAIIQLLLPDNPHGPSLEFAAAAPASVVFT